jgi:hypothetical protein
MTTRIASAAAALLTTLLFVLFVPLKSFAEDQPKLTGAEFAEGRSKAQIANALVILGRSAKDPDMLIVAARLLSTVPANVADPKASGEGSPVFYDPVKLMEEAKTYSAARTEFATPPNRAGFCHYEYLCERLSCSYEWVC